MATAGCYWDVLIYHSSSAHSEELVTRLKEILYSLQDDISEKPKVASTAEHFVTGSMFDSMEDALDRCTWMFILITEDLLSDPMSLFQNNQALTHSIFDQGGDKYVPIYENREKMRTLKIPSYIQMLQGFCISDLVDSQMKRFGMGNIIKSKLIYRKEREREHHDRLLIVERFAKQIKHIKHEFEKKRLGLTGAAEVEALKKQCASEIAQIAREQKINDVDEFLAQHHIDVSFLLSGNTSSLGSTSTSNFGSDKFVTLGSVELSLHEYDDKLHQVDTGQTVGKAPIEHDEAVEDDDMTGGAGAGSERPPSYQTTYMIRGEGDTHRMEELKPATAALPADHRVEVVGRGDPLEVPPCENEEPLIPIFVEEMQSVLTSFCAVPRSLRNYDRDADSMIAQCSEASIRDTSSLLDSQSNANLAELDDENMSQFSKYDSPHSSGEDEMDIGDNQVDLSLLARATGLTPLPLTKFHQGETDDESMVVEVDSTVGDDDITFNETPTTTPFKTLAKEEFKEPFKVPPARVMHRSFCADNDEDFDQVVPLVVDTDVEGGAASSPSPGLGELAMASWPRARRGSDAFRENRRYHSNLTTTRFLSLSSIQSLSSKLSRLHQHPSLNNISEWGDRPKLLDGIRSRYGW